MIYYNAYGRSFFREHAPVPADQSSVPEEQLRSCTLVLPGVIRDSPFDISQILAERRSMAAYLIQLSKIPREPTQAALQQWAESRPTLPASPDRSFWNMSGTQCVRLNPFVYRLLAAQTQPITLGELVKPLDEALAARLVLYFQKLAGHGLVGLSLAAGSAGDLATTDRSPEYPSAGV
jgi:hypothetical protein